MRRTLNILRPFNDVLRLSKRNKGGYKKNWRKQKTYAASELQKEVRMDAPTTPSDLSEIRKDGFSRNALLQVEKTASRERLHFPKLECCRTRLLFFSSSILSFSCLLVWRDYGETLKG